MYILSFLEKSTTHIKINKRMVVFVVLSSLGLLTNMLLNLLLSCSSASYSPILEFLTLLLSNFLLCTFFFSSFLTSQFFLSSFLTSYFYISYFLFSNFLTSYSLTFLLAISRYFGISALAGLLILSTVGE